MTQQKCIESKWARWAKKVLAQDGSMRRCNVCTKDDGTVFDRVLWPGYLGERYSEGRVLLVGAVHNAGQLRTPEMEKLAEVAERWALDKPGKGHQEYLSLVRSAYLVSASRAWIRNGQVWGLFRDVLGELDICWDQVAFTNWNKCKSLTKGVRKSEKKRLYRAHIGARDEIFDRLPLKELAPIALFICCGDAEVVRAVRDANLGSGTSLVRIFDQPGPWNKSEPPSKFPEIELYPKWLEDDAVRYKAMIGKPTPLACGEET